MMGQSGPRTALKCRIRGVMRSKRRVSIITAALMLVLTLAEMKGLCSWAVFLGECVSLLYASDSEGMECELLESVVELVVMLW
jgi:hypothetical protein